MDVSFFLYDENMEDYKYDYDILYNAVEAMIGPKHVLSKVL